MSNEKKRTRIFVRKLENVIKHKFAKASKKCGREGRSRKS